MASRIATDKCCHRCRLRGRIRLANQRGLYLKVAKPLAQRFDTLMTMRRNLELIQAILCWIEDQPDPWCEPPTLISGFEPARIAYHLDLCAEAGFIRQSPKTVKPSHVQLTWDGHEKLNQLQAQA